MLLGNRVALVTGASRGIGRAVALTLAREGATVVANYRSAAEQAATLLDEIRAMGGRGVALAGDVSVPETAQGLVDECMRLFGRIDILVNNAGITRDGLLVRMSDQRWQEVVDINLRGVFACTRAAARVMLKQKSGRIISISSVAGLTGNPGQANYCAAKAGIIGFSRAVARELAPRGITVNVVAPGLIATHMTEVLSAEARAGLLERVPLGRMGDPREVAAAVLFLASPDAGYITGQVLVVDGGMLA
jgi:3-oxoacyl-[acyl-carrier protein] reductase